MECLEGRCAATVAPSRRLSGGVHPLVLSYATLAVSTTKLEAKCGPQESNAVALRASSQKVSDMTEARHRLRCKAMLRMSQLIRA